MCLLLRFSRHPLRQRGRLSHRSRQRFRQDHPNPVHEGTPAPSQGVRSFTSSASTRRRATRKAAIRDLERPQCLVTTHAAVFDRTRS